MSNGAAAPKLDVEDDDQRQKRIGALLERLDTTSSSSSVSNPLLDIARERPPGPTEPPAALLARVRDFLPAISASNEALSRKRPEDIDIENVAGDEEQYIEMNLGLGILEAKPRSKPGSRSPSPLSETDSPTAATTSESESESESDSDSESYLYDDSSSEDVSDSSSDSVDDSGSDSGSRSGSSSVDMKQISSRPIKPLPRRVLQQPATGV